MTVDQNTQRGLAADGEARVHPHHIAVVDDDEAIRRLLRNVFEQEGYAVSDVRNRAELVRCLEAHDVSLITLDLTLGGEDGLAIAREIRTLKDVPIIMVTAKASDVDRIVGLEIGADDYIVKPFNVREVLARVRAVLRRTESPPRGHGQERQAGFRFDGWRLDISARHLTAPDGAAHDLTAAEFRLLEAFIKRPQRVLSRALLLDIVSGQDADPLERAVDTLVGRLRKKIEHDTAAPKIIKTVRGAGYVFAAKVTPV
jgi:two-component system, OmpR family, response regulator